MAGKICASVERIELTPWTIIGGVSFWTFTFITEKPFQLASQQMLQTLREGYG